MKNKFRLAAATAAAVMAAMLAACSPQPSTQDDSAKGDDAAAVAVAWNMQADCMACHEKQGESLEDGTCLAGSHASGNRATCTSCHTDEAGLASAHEGVTEAKNVRALKETEVTDEACLACHGSYDELAKRTTDYTGTTDKNGTTVNPHAVPETDAHAALSCVYCHGGHKEVKDISKSCMTCHHAEVYECGTCHEDK